MTLEYPSASQELFTKRFWSSEQKTIWKSVEIELWSTAQNTEERWRINFM